MIFSPNVGAPRDYAHEAAHFWIIPRDGTISFPNFNFVPSAFGGFERRVFDPQFFPSSR